MSELVIHHCQLVIDVKWWRGGGEVGHTQETEGFGGLGTLKEKVDTDQHTVVPTVSSG